MTHVSIPTPSLTHAHEHKPTQAQRAGFRYRVGHVRRETVEITSPVPKTPPFCPCGRVHKWPRTSHSYNSTRQHHSRTTCIQVEPARQTDLCDHCHKIKTSHACTECDHQKGIKYSTHTLVGLVLHIAIHLNLQETTTTERVNSACKSTDLWNQFLPFCLGVHGTREPRADETAR